MPTAAELAYFTDKKLMGFTDWDARLLRYLQNDIRQSVKRLFIQGSFSELMDLSSPGVDQVQIDLKAILGDGFAHDGVGRLLDLEQIDRTAQFENTPAQVYEVGAAYVEYPQEIRVNPRTGKPEYDRLVEGVGVEAEPDSVTNNGSDLTIRVDSLFEQGVAVGDHTGRIVRVYKKTPADGALTAAVAIETATVFFGGGQNQITTAGLLGQTTVSTDPADYVVQLVGITVLKNTATNRPSLTANESFFAGTVTGNGGTPVTFDTSGQAVIQAQTASGIQFVPFVGSAPVSWAISATDVQAAVEEVVNDLSNTGAGTDGARLVGLSSSTFTQQNPSASLSWGGLGTSGDHVFQKLTDANQQLVRRAQGITHSDGNVLADQMGADGIDTFDSELHLLKGQGAVLFTGAVTGLDPDFLPVVQGESPAKSILGVDAGVSNFNFYGVYRDLQFRAQQFSRLGEGGFFKAEGCLIPPNVFGMYGGSTSGVPGGFQSRFQPTILRDCYMPPSLAGSATPNSDSAFLLSTPGAGARVIENCVFDSGDSGSLVRLASTGFDATTVTVFRNCIFYQPRSAVDAYALELNGQAVFENCRIYKTSTDDDAPAVFLDSNAAGTVFSNCVIRSDNGNVIHTTTSGFTDPFRASFVNCTIESGSNTSTGPTTPQFLAGIEMMFHATQFQIGESSARASGATQSMVEVFRCKVANCEMFIGGTVFHSYKQIEMYDGYISNTNFSAPSSATPSAAMGGFVPGVWNLGGTVDNCRFVGTMRMSETQAENAHSALVLGSETFMTNTEWNVLVNNTAAASRGLRGWVTIGGDNVVIDGFRMERSGLQTALGYGFFEIVDDTHNAVISGVHMATAISFDANSGDNMLFHVNHCYNVEISHCSSEHEQNLESYMNWVIIDGGQHIHVLFNRWRMDQNGTDDPYFVRARSNIFDAKAISVIGNDFSWRNGTEDPSADHWINLSGAGGASGAYSVVDDNKCLNMNNGNVPTIQNAGTLAVTGNNILADNVSLYL